jgi:hypothetical protein
LNEKLNELSTMKKLLVLLAAGFLMDLVAGSEMDITGKWLMNKVIQDGKDVTEEHDPYDERYLILQGDGSFESGGRPFGKNTGKYILDPKEYTLFLESDAGPEDDSYWNVSIRKDTMYWQGYGSEWAENFQLIHVRAQE